MWRKPYLLGQQVRSWQKEEVCLSLLEDFRSVHGSKLELHAMDMVAVVM